MNAKKVTILSILVAISAVASAEVTVYPVGGRRGGVIIHSDFKHVPLSDPSEPYHETYRKNLGETARPAVKSVSNVHAKISAAEAAQAKREAAARNVSPISCYSNVTPARTSVPATVPQTRIINITNSNVVIQ